MTYQDKVRALEDAVPGHALIRVFRLIQSAGNEMLLDRELDKVRAAAPQAPAVQEGDDDPDEAEDETLRRLRMDQSTLFADRRKLSNSFHDCANDRQRAGVSEKIQVVQHRIEEVRELIRHYKQYGSVPEPDEKYPVPEDSFKLLATLHSLRASISRKKKEIEHLGREVAENDPAAPAKLEKAEAKLKDLRTHLEHVKKAIENRNLQPG